LEFTGVSELNVEIRGDSRSKYRDMIESAIKHLEEHPEDSGVKITKELKADASNISSGLKMWLKDSDNLLIFRRGTVVYILHKERIKSV